MKDLPIFSSSAHRRYANRLKAGKCTSCSGKREEGKTKCRKCLKIFSKREKKNRDRKKVLWKKQVVK